MTVVLAKEKLAAFGYELSEYDDILLGICAERYDYYVKHECRIADSGTLPRVLAEIAADMTVGEFLKAKLALSPSDVETLCGLPAVKQISLGDTSTEFSVSAEISPEKRLFAFAEHLLKNGRRGLSCYRKIHW